MPVKKIIVFSFFAFISLLLSCKSKSKSATSNETITENQWWKEAVVYQIYPLSFKDSDGDGVGIRGVYL